MQTHARSRFKRQRVKFSKLEATGFGMGFFTRDADESQAAFARRLRGHGEPGKVSAYVAAMRKGATFPPVIIARQDGELSLCDGMHRCSAAAIVGQADVDALIFDVVTDFDWDIVSACAFALMEDGQWETCAQIIQTMLNAPRRPVAAHA